MKSNVELIPGEPQIKERARALAREILGGSDVFKAMSVDDQRSIYNSLVQDHIAKEMSLYGLAQPMATDSGKDMGYEGYNAAFDSDTESFNELVDSVDFPKFVADLLKAVFDANLNVMKAQTDSYIKLMKESVKPAIDFIKQIQNDDTFAKLAESQSDKYNVITEEQPDGTSKLVLTNPAGEKHDVEDAEVKRHILEAKINMAKEHRAALREVLLMGVTRLVVEKGEIEAGVEFSVKATRQSKAHHNDMTNKTTSGNVDLSLGGIFGGPGAGYSRTKTNIQVNTSDKKATDDLSATLKGRVNIKFKTDYFKLDNFANMYADGGVAALKQGNAAGGSPGAPASK